MARPPGPGAPSFVNVMKHPVGWLARVLVDADLTGREHLPPHGPYIVTANHLSLIDPVLVTLTVGKMVRYLALDELFGQSRTLDEMMYYFGSIPVSRDRPPLGALRQSLAVLEEGNILGVFPEGGRSLYWGERPIKRGAAWLALATSAPTNCNKDTLSSTHHYTLIVHRHGTCAITGTEATLSLAEPGIRVPSVRLSLHPALDPAAYTERVDPLGAMMDDWVATLDKELEHWQPEDVT